MWLDQLPFFAPDAGRRGGAGGVRRRRLPPRGGCAAEELGDLHALTVLATSEIPVLAIGGRARPRHAAGGGAPDRRRPRRRASWWSSTASGTSRSPRRPTPTGAPCASWLDRTGEPAGQSGPVKARTEAAGGGDRAGRQQRGEDGGWFVMGRPSALAARGNAPIGRKRSPADAIAGEGGLRRIRQRRDADVDDAARDEVRRAWASESAQSGPRLRSVVPVVEATTTTTTSVASRAARDAAAVDEQQRWHPGEDQRRVRVAGAAVEQVADVGRHLGRAADRQRHRRTAPASRRRRAARGGAAPRCRCLAACTASPATIASATRRRGPVGESHSCPNDESPSTAGPATRWA